MDEGGDFGYWRLRQNGPPCFELSTTLSRDPRLVLPDDDPRRVWHQIGNDRITATAHAGGWVTPYWFETGLLRLSGTDPDSPDILGGIWTLKGPDGRVLAATLTDTLQATWEVGSASWEIDRDDVSIRRRVWAPFGDSPILRVDVDIAIRNEALRGGEWVEQWGFAPYPIVLGGLMSRHVDVPSTHTGLERAIWRAAFAGSAASRGATEVLRRGLGTRLALSPEATSSPGTVVLKPRRPQRRTTPTPLARLPAAVVVTAPSGSATQASFDVNRARTTVYLRTRLPADKTTTLSFAVGIGAESEVAAILDTARSRTWDDTATAWGRVWHFALDDPDEAASSLARESIWHGGMLRSAQVCDKILDCCYLPQGSAYSYIHGIQGAPRDYSITAVPLAHLDPAGARDLVRLMLRMMDPDGTLLYAHTGAGFCTSAVIHPSPTDLALAALWAITEYVWATGDTDFLDTTVPFRPRRRGTTPTSTVRDRARIAWHYVRDTVGVGAHGLLRAGSGDWSDPLSAMVPDRRAFHRDGESTYNTAFACYVLPRAADLLAADDPSTAAEIASYTAGLREALGQAWNNGWFLRGFDGHGGPIGARHLFLDANAWCLIAQAGSEDQRQRLVQEIHQRCGLPSPIGATILDHPHKIRGAILPAGWDCNGGVWAAINAFLAWGYALHDPELAWESLHAQSLAAHAHAYPHIWYGIWSGPDAYNSHFGDRAGETFVHPATPMTEFPVMNSNAHAGPLLALLKVLGIEATPTGIEVTPHLPPGFGDWTLRTQLVEVTGNGNSVEVARR